MQTTGVQNYGQAKAVKAPSLQDDTDRLITRLADLRDRLSSATDKLHGASPRDASSDAKAPSPLPTVRRNVDTANRIASDIADELTRLEAQL